MEELAFPIVGIPGALVRWGFWSLLGRRKGFTAYFNDDYDWVNVLIGFILVGGYFILTRDRPAAEGL